MMINRRCCWKWCVVVIMTAASADLGLNTGEAQQPPPRPDGQYGMQVLTRGPVHEAFAETISFDTDPGFIVTSAPPAPIDELPPIQKPDGINVDWIPGYWAWDDERADFLWVSGVWRSLPPDREWVPGYWGRTNQGFQWTSGYWADARATEIEYLPQPPATVEFGPNIAAPSVDDNWIPGTWVWGQGRYAWRAGYWMTVHPDWDWVPAHYVWTPRGYVFIDGYWDYSVERRGVLFAPVYFDSNVYAQRDFIYSPATVINLSVFSDHLFVRPRYNHYYFGDYYAPSYRDSGFYASFSFYSGRQGYDPIFAQQRWRNRKDPEWRSRVETTFGHRRDHEDARPRRTLVAQLSDSGGESRRGDRSFKLASSVEQYSRDSDNRVRFRTVDRDERQRTAQRGKEVQRFREERQQSEHGAADAAVEKTSRRSEPTRIKTRRSPIASRSSMDSGKHDAPPKRPRQSRSNSKNETGPQKKKVTKDHP